MLIKRIFLESLCGFLGVYLLALLAEWLLETAGMRRTPAEEWVLAELPIAVGCLLGVAVGALSSWRPTLTWAVPALFTLWDFAKNGTEGTAGWFCTDFVPHCTGNECIALHLFEYPLFSTVSFTLTIVVWRRIIDGGVRGRTQGDGPDHS